VERQGGKQVTSTVSNRRSLTFMSTQFDPLRTTAPELHLPFDNLVITGCSFTAGSSNMEEAVNNPQTWAHFLVKKFKFSTLANLAMSGGGNLSAGINLIHYLESHFCTPQNTLVLFNVTEFDRIDTITRHHPDSNKSFSWKEDMDIEWITEGSFLSNNLHKSKPFFGILQKNIGYESTIIFNVLQSLLVHEYLCSRGYIYRWMYMDDHCRQQIPNQFVKSMEKFEKYRITFGDFPAMYEYVKSMKMTVSETDRHPNVEGYKKIAEFVSRVIEEEISE
jgi:hypothetical protein